jgi:hypothetical protein
VPGTDLVTLQSAFDGVELIYLHNQALTSQVAELQKEKDELGTAKTRAEADLAGVHATLSDTREALSGAQKSLREAQE